MNELCLNKANTPTRVVGDYSIVLLEYTERNGAEFPFGLLMQHEFQAVMILKKSSSGPI